MSDPKHRFSGALAEEYELITLAYPDFEAFQRQMIAAIGEHAASGGTEIVEIGTGNGFTTRLLLEIPGVRLRGIDNDTEMVSQARDSLGEAAVIIEADALEYLQGLEEGSADVIASAFTLHNMEVEYRNSLEEQIFRVLRPGGLFTNADKYAPDGQDRFDALVYQVERFFDAFLESGKHDLLRKWVTHNITDQSPRFVMLASEAPKRLGELGFEAVRLRGRSHMQAVLTAVKPG